MPADFCTAPAHFVDIGGDHIRVQQIGLDGSPQAVFGFPRSDQGGIVAAAGLPVVGTAPVVLCDHGVGSLATAAGHEAGKEPLRPPGPVGRQRSIGIQSGLNLLPDRFINDAQLGHIVRHQVGRFVDAGNPLAGGGVFLERLPIVEDAAPVQFVVEDAVAACPVAGDGIGPPKAATGRGDAFAVQLAGDGQGAGASGIGNEDAADHFGLFRINFAQAFFRFPIIPESPHRAIAVGEAAGDAARFHPAALTATDLFPQLFKEEGGHRAAHTDVERAHFTFRQGDDPGASEAGAFEDIGQVFLVTGQAIKAFCQQDLRAALFDGGHAQQQAGPIADRAADRAIMFFGKDGPPFAIGADTQQAQLILHRFPRLQGG